MAWKAFFSTWVGRAGLQGRAGPPDPAHPAYPFPAQACGWGRGAGEQHAGLRFYKAEVSSSCSTGLPAGGRGGRPRQEPLLLGGGRDFCPRHRELPRAPVPQSPRDQQALRPALPMTSSGCVALTLHPPGPDSTTGPGVWVHLQDTLLRVRTPSTGPPGSSSRAPWGIPVRSWSRVPRALVFTNARPQATPHVVTCPSKL